MLNKEWNGSDSLMAIKPRRVRMGGKLGNELVTQKQEWFDNLKDSWRVC